MTPLQITLVILLVTIIAFASGKIPIAVISSGIMIALILTGVRTPEEAFSGFVNTNVVMFVAMFVIGAGLTKTKLIDHAQNLVIRYKENPRMLILLSCLAASLMACITNATATAAIMIPLLVGIANDIGTSRSKLLFPAMACANVATSMTFLGQGQQHDLERYHDGRRRTTCTACMGFYHRTNSTACCCNCLHGFYWS